jgi:hypothetical protein
VRHHAAVQGVGQPGHQCRPALGEFSSGQLRLRGRLSMGTQSGLGIRERALGEIDERSQASWSRRAP